jgi:hypothetical protein
VVNTTFVPRAGQPVLDERFVQDLAAYLKDDPGLTRAKHQGEQCHYCAQPIRLVGTTTRINATTGEVLSEYSSLSEPGGVVFKACGTRRATRCLSCSLVYKADARMLVRSGLVGGKGIDTSVATHPMVFATFTAPSYGPVHTSIGRCHVGAARRCLHGRPRNCGQRHDDADPLVGTPLCADCYDYEGAVAFNASCPELWRRTTITIMRELAKELGLSARVTQQRFRLSFAKVAEYQRRGLVHVHTLIRLDGRDDELTSLSDVTTSMIASAVRRAATRVAVSLDVNAGGDALREPHVTVRWGAQCEVHAVLDSGDATTLDASRVANYLAKYATKSADDSGALDRRLNSLDDLSTRQLSPHLATMAATAWRLGAKEGQARLRRWAHCLGFAGHFLTKSRRYSVTFKYLRAERRAWRIERTAMTRGNVNDGDLVTTFATWRWVASGWRTSAERWLASLGAKEAVIARELARETTVAALGLLVTVGAR